MKNFNLFLIILSVLGTTQAMAQFRSIDISNDTRYDLITNDGDVTQNRIQDRIKIGFTFDANGYFELVGLIASGPSYGNDWATIHDFEADDNSFDPQLAFRRLYLRKLISDSDEIRLGALEGIDSIGSGGLGSSGWVDGLQILHKSEAFNFNVRVGSLYDTDNPNLFTRDHEINFVEIEISKKILKRIMLRAGYEYFNDHFIKAGIEINSDLFGKEILKFIASVIYDVDNHGVNFDIGAKIDILRAFKESWRNYLMLDIYVSRTDEALNFRNSLYSAYYQDATTVNVSLSGRIDRDGRFNWFIRESFGGNQSRMDAGLSVHF